MGRQPRPHCRRVNPYKIPARQPRYEEILNRNFWNIVIFGGVFLSVTGCFQPWGQEYHDQFIFLYPATIIGITILPGLLALAGGTVAALLQALYVTRRNTYLPLFVFAGTFVASSLSSAWILQPHIFWYSGVAILYGAYVALAGGLIAALGSLMQLFTIAERAVSVIQSTAKV